jgi:hypothetical protein
MSAQSKRPELDLAGPVRSAGGKLGDGTHETRACRQYAARDGAKVRTRNGAKKLRSEAEVMINHIGTEEERDRLATMLNFRFLAHSHNGRA